MAAASPLGAAMNGARLSVRTRSTCWLQSGGSGGTAGGSSAATVTDESSSVVMSDGSRAMASHISEECGCLFVPCSPHKETIR